MPQKATTPPPWLQGSNDQAGGAGEPPTPSSVPPWVQGQGAPTKPPGAPQDAWYDDMAQGATASLADTVTGFVDLSGIVPKHILKKAWERNERMRQDSKESWGGVVGERGADALQLLGGGKMGLTLTRKLLGGAAKKGSGMLGRQLQKTMKDIKRQETQFRGQGPEY